MVADLIKIYRADYTLRDKGGLTPLDHAINKSLPEVEWQIRTLTMKSFWEKARVIIKERSKERR